MSKVTWVQKGQEIYDVCIHRYKIHYDSLAKIATVFYNDGSRLDIFNPDIVAYEAEDVYKKPQEETKCSTR